MAIKVVNKQKAARAQATVLIEREITVLKMVKHPNIIECYEVIETKHNWYIIMEYVSGGELLDYIEERGKLTEKEASTFLLQLITGVGYLHEQGIYHRDLKLENIMLDKEKNVKIVDFGLAAIDAGKLLTRQCGSIHYIAPEVLKGPYQGTKADIWCCGIIFFAMVTGTMPFYRDNAGSDEIFSYILH